MRPLRSASLKSRSSARVVHVRAEGLHRTDSGEHLATVAPSIIRKVTDPSGDTTTDFDYTRRDVETDDGTADPFVADRTAQRNGDDDVPQRLVQCERGPRSSCDPATTRSTDIDCGDGSAARSEQRYRRHAPELSTSTSRRTRRSTCTFTNTKNLNSPATTSSPSRDSAGLPWLSAISTTRVILTARPTVKIDVRAVGQRRRADGNDGLQPRPSTSRTTVTTSHTTTTGDPADNNGYTISCRWDRLLEDRLQRRRPEQPVRHRHAATSRPTSTCTVEQLARYVLVRTSSGTSIDGARLCPVSGKLYETSKFVVATTSGLVVRLAATRRRGTFRTLSAENIETDVAAVRVTGTPVHAAPAGEYATTVTAA